MALATTTGCKKDEPKPATELAESNNPSNKTSKFRAHSSDESGEEITGPKNQTGETLNKLDNGQSYETDKTEAYQISDDQHKSDSEESDELYNSGETKRGPIIDPQIAELTQSFADWGY